MTASKIGCCKCKKELEKNELAFGFTPIKYAGNGEYEPRTAGGFRGFFLCERCFRFDVPPREEGL